MKQQFLSNTSFLFLFIWLFASPKLHAQEPQTFPRNGTYDERDGHYALLNARIFVGPGQVLEKGQLIVKKGKIVDIGRNLPIPKDAVQIDLQGKYIYPGFIELYSDYGIDKAKAVGKAPSQSPQMLSNKEGAYAWNEALKPEFEAHRFFKPDEKEAKKKRNIGFTSTLSQQMDGIARGSSSLVFLGDGAAQMQIIKDRAAAHYSFSKGVSTQSYPSSLMGCIALLRQSYYDAKWYAQNTSDREYNISLDAWNGLQKLPQIFETTSRLNLLRADKLGDEFGIQYIFKTAGDEYLRLDAIKATKGSCIVPLSFPKPYDLGDPYSAVHISLDQMRHWEQAPSNARRLKEANIPFALTAYDLKKEGEFFPALRKLYQHGLSEEAIVEALTLSPAKILGMEQELGSLDKGKWANFFICSGSLLAEDMEIYQTWVRGNMYMQKELPSVNLLGEFELQFGQERFIIEGKGKAHKAKLTLRRSSADSSKKEKLSYTLRHKNLDLSFALPNSDTTNKEKLAYSLSLRCLNDTLWTGRGKGPDAQWQTCQVLRLKKGEAQVDSLPERDSLSSDMLYFPALAYGYSKEEEPKQETVLFRNATIWTGEQEGILENTDLLIERGLISQIGKNLKAPAQAKVIEAVGLHITAGIIDEHSHIAINAGVNEGTQSSTAEVRIGDVINSEDMNIYRQLAGGVTSANLLHGSANAIGGQAALIKLRWGKLPEDMKMAEAPGFIKFALGENVKQSNWGDKNSIRFPQTRMGVEQVYEDYFTRAKEYKEQRALYGDAVRRDLDLETVLEILEGQRFITCHSYVQSEITMLMRVAERHGFRVNTFTHILEGYKIADKMKEHGVGGSSFADWWAYKMEVQDAIPNNAVILDKMGVVTALNSDDAEMGRRLNQEAAKMVKYGNISPEKAWNMVTLNPAKLLRIDKYVGSIKPGKQADIVLWSASPLSIYAKVEQSYVDGICYYERQRDAEQRKKIVAERARLRARMLDAKAKGEKTQPVSHTHENHYHCNTQYQALPR